MHPHEAQQEPEAGISLPSVAMHFIQQRRFTRSHFVVRQRQYEIFCEGISQTGGQPVLMVGTKQRITSEVRDAVMQPTPVPRHIETQAAVIDRPGCPGGRVVGNAQRVGKLCLYCSIQAAQEVCCFGIDIIPRRIEHR